MKTFLFLFLSLVSESLFGQYTIQEYNKEDNEIGTPTINQSDTLDITIAYDELFDTYYFGIIESDPKSMDAIYESNFIYTPEITFGNNEALYFRIAYPTGNTYRVAIFDNPFDEEGFKIYLTDLENGNYLIYRGNLKLNFTYYTR
jgi:hypothetical protein